MCFHFLIVWYEITLTSIDINGQHYNKPTDSRWISYVSTFNLIAVDWNERCMSTMRTCQTVKRWKQTSWLNRFCRNTSDHGKVTEVQTVNCICILMSTTNTSDHGIVYRTEEQTVNCICMCTLVYVSCTCCNFAADYFTL